MADPTLLRPLALSGKSRDWTGRWPGEAVWAILTAARSGDEARLERLLASDPSLARAAYAYTPALHFAVREGHLGVTRLLVEAGADLSHRGLYGQETLLQMALDRDHEEVAAYLRGEQRRRRGAGRQRHPIHDAVAAGSADEVEGLLRADPSLADRGDPLGRRPLHYAVEAGRRDLVDLLLDHGAAVDVTGFGGDDRLGGPGFRPVALALWHHPYWRQRNDLAMARHLLARGAEPSIVIDAALGDADAVQAHLRRDPGLANAQESCGKRALSAAAERGHGEIVRLLLTAGADPNLEEGENCPKGYSLWAASHFGHREIAEALLAAGADPNADVDSSGNPTESAGDSRMRSLLYRHGGRVRLAAHVHEGNLDVIAALLDARPEIFDEAAAEVFTHAVSCGREEVVRLLLARGVRVPPMVTSCQTYLWQDLSLCRLLLESGMDPDLPNWQQVRPLHHQAARGEIDAARLFLEHGADQEAVDEEFRTTPLGWAARTGQREFARFLLEEAGSDPRPANVPAWSSPAEWARRRGHSGIAELLEKAAESDGGR